MKNIDKIYSLALKLGGVSEDNPGYRDSGSFYGAYFRGLDGNKIAIFTRKISG
ncbi:hypothetical protein ACJJIW_14835 [Microbulbifer sp. JMSA004]|uniref:hypothetical protein n=1 Tax=Microbulbifer sp. JMSA004 TaxID=3243370 RepID=UPI00403A1CD4